MDKAGNIAKWLVIGAISLVALIFVALILKHYGII